jgi:putative transposase
MVHDEKIHHRRSIRLKGYDYSQPGAYFVTICAFQRQEIFGEIIDAELRLSKLGDIIRSEWFHSAEIRKEVQLFEDEFIVMPNHIHGIVWIVPTELVMAKSLGSFIGGFKAAVTRHAGQEMNSRNIWQRNYYEHVIRNAKELESFWKYIDTNADCWQEDQLHPSAVPNQFNNDD